ncbi:MAG: tetratricopeptide repeat protein [Bdellovibrionaceae bacterium]|nr:tetratricopeptide repeat protein [Pseudobdellovibrionaceae bacterium]
MLQKTTPHSSFHKRTPFSSTAANTGYTQKNPMPARPVKALQQAQALHQRGSFKESIEQYKQILKAQPTCAEAAFAISVLYNDLGQYQNAKVYFAKAVQAKAQQNPSLLPLKNEVVQKYQELAYIYSKYKQPQVALKYYLTALSLNPKDKNTFIALGQVLIELKQYSQAISIFKYLNSQDPHSYIIPFQLAHAYYKNKQTLQAIIIWTNLSKQFPYKKELVALTHLTQALKAV